MKEVETYLQDDLRLDMLAFTAMNKAIIEQCAAIGKKRKALELLLKLLLQ